MKAAELPNRIFYTASVQSYYLCIVVLDIQTGKRAVNNTKCLYSSVGSNTVFQSFSILHFNSQWLFAETSAPDVRTHELMIFDRAKLDLIQILAPKYAEYLSIIETEGDPKWRYIIFFSVQTYIVMLRANDDFKFDSTLYRIDNKIRETQLKLFYNNFYAFLVKQAGNKLILITLDSIGIIIDR